MPLEASLTPKRSIALPTRDSNMGTYTWWNGQAIETRLRTLVCNAAVAAPSTTRTYVPFRHGAC